jgi:hypothetical protein
MKPLFTIIEWTTFATVCGKHKAKMTLLNLMVRIKSKKKEMNNFYGIENCLLFQFWLDRATLPLPHLSETTQTRINKGVPKTRRSTIGHLVKCDAYMSLLAGGKKQKVPPNKITCKYMQIPIEIIICGGHLQLLLLGPVSGKGAPVVIIMPPDQCDAQSFTTNMTPLRRLSPVSYIARRRLWLQLLIHNSLQLTSPYFFNSFRN